MENRRIFPLQKANVPVWKLQGTEAESDPCIKFLSHLVHGISGILSYAKEGIRLWFWTKRPVYRQLCLKLAVWIDKRICLPKSGSGGAYESASIHKTAALYLFKIWQIGALGDYIHFGITVCGNSSKSILSKVFAYAIMPLGKKIWQFHVNVEWIPKP